MLASILKHGLRTGLAEPVASMARSVLIKCIYPAGSPASFMMYNLC
jgi:hypothetical protein